MDSPYLQLRPKQYRGPTNSDDYNSQNEELYKDITVLYNRANFSQAIVDEGYRQIIKNIYSMQRAMSDLEARMNALESIQNVASFFDADQIENARFVGTPYEIAAVSQNNVDTTYGFITLPLVQTSSQSKIAFVGPNGSTIPPTLETKVVGIAGTADDVGVTIDTSQPEYAIVRSSGRIWERNVVAMTPNASGAQCYLYIKAPTDLFTTDKSNTILLNPFPSNGTDILEIAYTSEINFTLASSEQYNFFPAIHVSQAEAVGFVPPGSWGNGDDQDSYAPPRAYYFDPVVITGLRIKLGQRDYIAENGRFIYSYGLSNIDLRYNKFLSTGKSLIRFDAAEGQTISDVVDLSADIWNVSEAEQSDVFSYRVIWETSYQSGVYTTNTVPLSDRVWIEVTLNLTVNGATPSLSGITLHYA